MPLNSDRPLYPVVTWLTVGIAVLMVGAQFGRRYLPPPDRNDVATNVRPFLRAAGNQDIDWQPFELEKLEEARREQRPIFMVIGTEANTLARELDQDAFRDPDLSDATREYLCIRADSMVRPDLIPSILPVSYAQDHRDANLLLLVFDSGLNLVGKLHKRSASHRIRASEVSYFLKEHARQIASKPLVWELSDQQLREQAMLLNPTERVAADPILHQEWLISTLDPSSGTWPSSYALMAYPQALTFLMRRGMTDRVDELVEPYLESGMIDWIDGGFYVRATAEKWSEVEFDKIAVCNADLALVFAQLYCSTSRPIYRLISEQAISNLVNRFVEGRLVHPYQVGTRGVYSRSPLASLTPRQMGEILKPEEQAIAVNLLNLRVENNRQMIPMILDSSDPEILNRTQGVLEVIRKSREKRERPIGGIRTPAVATNVLSRLREAAQLIDTTEFNQDLDDVFIELGDLVDEQGRVKRSVDLLEYEAPSLTDPVGMADANLTDYLLTGSPLSAEQARIWIIRALKDFQYLSEPTVTSLSKRQWGDALANYSVPIVADGNTISPIAHTMRVAYGVMAHMRLNKLTGDPDYKVIESFLNDALLRYGSVANSIHRRYSGYFLASEVALSDEYWVVAGQNAPAASAELRRQMPHALILPHTPRVAVNSEITESGIYRFIKGRRQGPLGPQQIAAISR